MTVCIATFRHKPGVAGIRLMDLQGFREVARCYTIGPGIVTPEIVAGPGMASHVACRRPGLDPSPHFYYSRHMDTLVDDLGQRLAQRIRLERDSRGWSLAELAERSGVSKATISKIERAEVSPTAVVLVRLASAFDLTLAGLMLRAEGQGRSEERRVGKEC